MAHRPATVDAAADWHARLKTVLRDAGALPGATSRRVLAACLSAGLTPSRIIPSTLSGVSFYFDFSSGRGYANITVTDENELLLTIHDGDRPERSSVREFNDADPSVAEMIRLAKAAVR
jgi:hypothetical protein